MSYIKAIQSVFIGLAVFASTSLANVYRESPSADEQTIQILSETLHNEKAALDALEAEYVPLKEAEELARQDKAKFDEAVARNESLIKNTKLLHVRKQAHTTRTQLQLQENKVVSDFQNATASAQKIRTQIEEKKKTVYDLELRLSLLASENSSRLVEVLKLTKRRLSDFPNARQYEKNDLRVLSQETIAFLNELRGTMLLQRGERKELDLLFSAEDQRYLNRSIEEIEDQLLSTYFAALIVSSKFVTEAADTRTGQRAFFDAVGGIATGVAVTSLAGVAPLWAFLGVLHSFPKLILGALDDSPSKTRSKNRILSVVSYVGNPVTGLVNSIFVPYFKTDQEAMERVLLKHYFTKELRQLLTKPNSEPSKNVLALHDALLSKTNLREPLALLAPGHSASTALVRRSECHDVLISLSTEIEKLTKSF